MIVFISNPKREKITVRLGGVVFSMEPMEARRRYVSEPFAPCKDARLMNGSLAYLTAHGEQWVMTSDRTAKVEP